ncbi:pentapeptide repeat-containing protein [Nocardia iowensis]|uniref:Pentapeptide repeat-containing protein n=1 Tax=Nocardia iowensis TaxID=204891 RepID=A0ABX8RMQ0_NOCIO|nr:pentapeptide repeat-containing protein [Nocardia iowensis]QXN90267.1 pentapeptide repeat-containing protein [Nocardia iowensis]
MKAVALPATLAIGVILGWAANDVYSHYLSREFWDIAAQPIATGLTGIAAVAAASIVYINGKEGRDDENARHRERADHDRDVALRDRFNTIASQIADSSPAIRLAGVYALIALADDWDAVGRGSEREVCVDLLRAYLRVPMPETPSTNEREVPISEEVGEIAIRTLIVETIAYRQHGAWGNDDTSLDRASIPFLDLQDIELDWASLRYADLRRTNLSNGRLQGTDLRFANLEGIVLDGTEYSSDTQWPDGFQPPPTAILVEEASQIERNDS